MVKKEEPFAVYITNKYLCKDGIRKQSPVIASPHRVTRRKTFVLTIDFVFKSQFNY